MAAKRVHIWIYGHVQGVTFRASTRSQARKRGVRGWVKNLDDGSVEAVLEGPSEEVDAVVRWCHAGGPPAASVDDMVVEEETPTGEFDSFDIAHG